MAALDYYVLVLTSVFMVLQIPLNIFEISPTDFNDKLGLKTFNEISN